MQFDMTLVWVFLFHRGMLLDEYFEELSENPKINESLNPESLRSFLHKVTEFNQTSMLVVRIQNL